MEIGDLSEPPQGAASAELRPPVAAARAIQEERFRESQVHVNAHMTPPQIEDHCRPEAKGLPRIFHEAIYCGVHLLATTLEFGILVLDIRFSSMPPGQNAEYLRVSPTDLAPSLRSLKKYPG